MDQVIPTLSGMHEKINQLNHAFHLTALLRAAASEGPVMHKDCEMNSQSYLALNAWLQKADQNYIEGRLLWLNHLINGACNLLWLASEQILKILILQKTIDSFSENSSDLKQLHETIDKEGMKLGHSVIKLIQRVNSDYPGFDISKYEKVLEKIQEYFYRRYVVHSGSSISLLMLNEVDEFYFLVRGKIEPDVGLGTIDEIHIQRKHKWGHPLPAFSYAYQYNEHFRPRKHREINQIGPDGVVRKENGE